MRDYIKQLTMTYGQLIFSLNQAPAPSPKKADPEEFVSALLQMLENEAKNLQNTETNEGEIVLSTDFLILLKQLEQLEEKFSKDPKMQHLACEIRAKIDTILNTLNAKKAETPEVKTEPENKLPEEKVAEEEKKLTQPQCHPQPKSKKADEDEEKKEPEEVDNKADEPVPNPYFKF